MSKRNVTPAAIEWSTERRLVGELLPYDKNPRRITDKQRKDLVRSLKKFSLAEIPVINTDNVVIAGHQRLGVLLELHGAEYEIEVRVPNRQLSEKEFQEYNIRSNKNTGEWDFELLVDNFSPEDLTDWGFESVDKPAEQGDKKPAREDEEFFEDDGISDRNQYGVIVMCSDEAEQEKAFTNLTAQGYSCKVVVV